MRFFGFLFFFAAVFSFNALYAQTLPSESIKGEHFIIHFEKEVGLPWANQVLREAERYYEKIAAQLGYKRYKDFWTWNNRAVIIIYATQENFAEETGFPDWSRGVAIRDHNFSLSRTIITYKQEHDFLNGVLPHEIAHLIMRDFFKRNDNIPLWLDEGVAQLQEEQKREKARGVMKSLMQNNQHIPLKQLANYDIRIESDPVKVAIFYVQSVSIVDFMIQKYGSYKFGQFCSAMSEGKTFAAALQNIYKYHIDTLHDLERRWLQYVKSY